MASKRILPGWPAAMRDDLAASYLDMSVTTFRMHVVPDVPGIQMTPGCVGWAREDLDQWLDNRRRQRAGSPPVNEWHIPASRSQ